MKPIAILLASVVLTPLAHAASKPDPAADLKAFQSHFHNQFPKVGLKDFVSGPYNFSASMRAQWKQILEFPPYQFALDHGKKLFDTPFANGRTYAACFPHKGIGIAQDYPRKASAEATLARAGAGAGQAAAMHDQWTPTAAALKAARAAFKTGDYAKAQSLAARAAKFAASSVEQARQQKKLWRNEVVR